MTWAAQYDRNTVPAGPGEDLACATLTAVVATALFEGCLARALGDNAGGFIVLDLLRFCAGHDTDPPISMLFWLCVSYALLPLRLSDRQLAVGNLAALGGVSVFMAAFPWFGGLECWTRTLSVLIFATVLCQSHARLKHGD